MYMVGYKLQKFTKMSKLNVDKWPAYKQTHIYSDPNIIYNFHCCLWTIRIGITLYIHFIWPLSTHLLTCTHVLGYTARCNLRQSSYMWRNFWHKKWRLRTNDICQWLWLHFKQGQCIFKNGYMSDNRAIYSHVTVSNLSHSHYTSHHANTNKDEQTMFDKCSLSVWNFTSEQVFAEQCFSKVNTRWVP
jgi:hypothetical protein